MKEVSQYVDLLSTGLVRPKPMAAGGRVLARRDKSKKGSAPDIGHFSTKTKMNFENI